MPKKGQFQYTMTLPQVDEMEDDDDDFQTSAFSDLLISASLFLPFGAIGGSAASIIAPEFRPEFAAIGGSVAVAVPWVWLFFERIKRYRTLRYFTEQKSTWKAAKDETIGGNVKLTIDHRYRDGNTEAGRTVNRFGELPVDVNRFNDWAQGALVGKSLGVSHWTPKAKMFTRPEYDALLDKLAQGNIIINLGSNKGNTLTGGGRRALRQHLGDFGISPPSPASEDFFGQRLAGAATANGGNTPLPCSDVRVRGGNGA